MSYLVKCVDVVCQTMGKMERQSRWRQTNHLLLDYNLSNALKTKHNKCQYPRVQVNIG
jgi:hypothetical protein